MKFALRDFMSVEKTDMFDTGEGGGGAPLWAVYFLGVEVALEPEPSPLRGSIEEALFIKYEPKIRYRISQLFEERP